MVDDVIRGERVYRNIWDFEDNPSIINSAL